MRAALIFLVWVCALVSISEQAPSFVITAPKIIHLGVDENVAVQVRGVQGPVTVTMYFENQVRAGQPMRCSDEVVFHLPVSGDVYEKVISLKIPMLKAEQCELLKQVRQKYVHLVAVSPQIFTKRNVPIRWSSRRGYLFIQTDKPIYTPNEQVQFRVFTLDHVMKPTHEAVTIHVFNSRDIQVMMKEKISVSSIINENLMIPDIAEPGTWKIVARFSNSPMSNVTAEFEVKKFVLPGFEVKIIPSNMYYTVRDPSFKFQITAMYTYGEGVNGVAYVRFGIIDEYGNKTFIKGIEQQMTVVQGNVNEIELKSLDLVAKLNQQMESLVGFHLYISATVVETASGEMEETEETRVKFVSSPYSIDLSRTKRFFAPGMPFYVVAAVTYPDGSLVPTMPARLLVKMTGSNNVQAVQNTNRDGLAQFPVNIPATATTMNIKVSVGDAADISSSEMDVTLYQSSSKSYLYIDVPQGIFKLSDPVNIALKDITQPGGNVDFFYYLILNKGQILRMSKVKRSFSTVVQLQVDEDMIPSFRIVAYYYLGTEIIANSVWVDVVDDCKGKLELKPTMPANNYFEPGSILKMKVSTSGEASVSLVAVDTAVYVLNKKNKLTPNKVFAAMNSYDLGCTMGSGQNNLGVFSDAGLSILSDTITSSITEEYSCKSGSRREKRSLEFQIQAQGKANEYQDERVKKCCKDGMIQIRMKLTCNQRAERIKAPLCRSALLDCCQFAEKLRAAEKNTRKPLPGLARTHQENEEEDDFFDESSILTRTVFPQSWMWTTIQVNGERTETKPLPDSITTWEIQAVSMSKTKGICIAEPVPVKVFKKFHISLRLPYAVKRFEQLEVRAVLYNYFDAELKFTVSMKDAEGICSPAISVKGSKKEVTLSPKSAQAIYFSVVPMKLGEIPIHILAYDTTYGISDGIIKTLRVIGEGVTKIEEKTFHINPEVIAARSFTIDSEQPSNMVPDTPSQVYVRLSGEVSEETLDNCLTPDKINGLIRVPTGCGEQTMISMAPAVSTVEYLDQSEQWIRLKPERKDEALVVMQSGYSRILEYKKDDGSYGAWKTHPSSTWLTAFVTKVLSKVKTYIQVDKKNVLHKAVTYLIKQQKTTGAFNDPAPVIHREMQGGVGGVEGDVSLTAFVLIALHHVEASYTEANEMEQLSDLKLSIKNAADFLHKKLPSLKRPYAVAISAYALALTFPDSSAAKEASEKLKEMGTYDKEKGILYWESDDSLRVKGEARVHLVPQSSAITVEATSYALLHALLNNDIAYANPIVRWLTEQQNYGGGFRSTQDTVLALEALSQYYIKTFGKEDVNLDIVLSSPARGFNKHIRLKKASTSVQEDVQFPLGSNIDVNIQGQGKGALTVMKVYNVMEVDNGTCRDIKMEVTVKGEVKYDKNTDYDYDYDNPEEEVPDEPISRIEWFDHRNRRRREAKAPGSNEKNVIYEICIQKERGAKVSGMAIADITLLSGFEPNLNDLEKLTSLEDRYISHFEFKQGRLLLYFDEVPTWRECVEFEANQILPIGLVQPATATLYDFYEPAQKCIVFYNAPHRSTIVNTLCSGEVCQCAEGPCPKERKTFTENITEDIRMKHACYSPIVEYGYKVKVLRATQQNSFEVYECQVVEPLRSTRDEDLKSNDIRYFLKRKSCRLQMAAGKEYLLMGKDGKTKDASGNIQYLLDSNTWIEEIPDEKKCKGTRYRSTCKELNDFLSNYHINGCAV